MPHRLLQRHVPQHQTAACRCLLHVAGKQYSQECFEHPLGHRHAQAILLLKTKPLQPTQTNRAHPAQCQPHPLRCPTHNLRRNQSLAHDWNIEESPASRLVISLRTPPRCDEKQPIGRLRATGHCWVEKRSPRVGDEPLSPYPTTAILRDRQGHDAEWEGLLPSRLQAKAHRHSRSAHKEPP